MKSVTVLNPGGPEKTGKAIPPVEFLLISSQIWQKSIKMKHTTFQLIEYKAGQYPDKMSPT